MTDTDPRLHHTAALAWVRSLVAAVPPERLGDPTPCDDYDVRTLLGHLLATVHKVCVVAADRHPDTVPHVLTGVPDDGWTAALDEAAERARASSARTRRRPGRGRPPGAGRWRRRGPSRARAPRS